MASDEKLDIKRDAQDILPVGPVSVSTVEERRLVRKLDRRILPITCLMYMFSYLDRGNLGNARLQGLVKDVLGGDPTGKRFDWVNSVFFITAILFLVPATLLAKLSSPRLWLGSAAICWGICSTLSSTATNEAGLVVARIGLGVFEAGFGSAIPVYFTLFYTKHEVGSRLAYWFGFSALASAFGGLIAFGIQHVHATIANWRLLFIIEGIPAVLLGLMAIFFLPGRPETTDFLTEEERELALARANRDTSGDIGYHLNKRHITDAFKDWRIYIGGVTFFGATTALTSISAFLPTIIKTFGYTNALAQLLSVPPYAVAAIVITSSSWLSDRLLTRGTFIVISSAVSGVGYLIFLTVEYNNHMRYFATFLVVSGTTTTIGLVIAWNAHNLGSETKRATGMPLYFITGQFGGILGSHLFPTTEGPRYIRGYSVLLGLLFLGSVCASVLTTYFRYENARRNRMYGKPIPNARVDTSALADRAPGFRYTV